jgi:hypothetical protein
MGLGWIFSGIWRIFAVAKALLSPVSEDSPAACRLVAGTGSEYAEIPF